MYVGCSLLAPSYRSNNSGCELQGEKWRVVARCSGLTGLHDEMGEQWMDPWIRPRSGYDRQRWQAADIQRIGCTRSTGTGRVFISLLMLSVVASVPGVCRGDGSADLSSGRRRPISEHLDSVWLGTKHTRHRRSGPDALNCNVTLEPDSLRIVESQVHLTNFSVICSVQTPEDNFTLSVQIEDTEVARIQGKDRFTGSIISPIDDSTSLVFLDQLQIKGQSFGRTLMETRVELELDENDNTLPPYVMTSEVVVLKENSIINIIYLAIVGLMIVIYNFAFGCKIEWSLIVAILKKPVAPAIGFCCQFLVMAPLSFGVAMALHMSDVTGLGLLAIGASPGGGGSNVFAYLLGGDLELSITMSFISTVFSLGLTPLWIWALGRYFTEDSPQIQIPVSSVFSSLAVVTVPVVLGLVVHRCNPEAAKRVASVLKPFTGIIGVVFITMGVYVYYKALVKVDASTLLACSIVPLAGYIIGAVSGLIFRQPRARWLTISLETGFQNLALSLMIVGMSLEQPDSDLAGVVPICYTFLSASFPTIAFLAKLVYRLTKRHCTCCNRNALDRSPTLELPGSPPDRYVVPTQELNKDLRTVSSLVDRNHVMLERDNKVQLSGDNVCTADGTKMINPSGKWI